MKREFKTPEMIIVEIDDCEIVSSSVSETKAFEVKDQVDDVSIAGSKERNTIWN